MKPGAATPTPAMSPSARRLCTISTTASMMASPSPAGVGRRSCRPIVPSSATRPPAIFVPPMSIPMACTSHESSQRPGGARMPSGRSGGRAGLQLTHCPTPLGTEGAAVNEIYVPAVVPADPEANATDLLVDRVAATPDSPLFALPTADGGWEDVSTAEFHRQVVALAKGFIAAGVQPGDKIGF